MNSQNETTIRASNESPTPRVSPSAPADVALRTSLHEITDSLVKFGSIWAEHGLSIGRLALKTTAQSLDNVADVLGQIATAVKAPHGASSQAASTGETTNQS